MIARRCVWRVEDVAIAVGASRVGRGKDAEAIVHGVTTDSREVEPGTLFVALVGPNFDGHAFLESALDRGAKALLVEEDAFRARVGALHLGDAVPIVVKDTLLALGDLGRAHRRRFGGPVYALTGSNGKTTTKEMLFAIFGVSRRVLKTEGNLNNLIGVPMTILGLEATHEVAVIEMGMNQPGEIARYAEIAEPDVGLVLNVGPAHIGRLGSLQAIANAKGELYAGLDPARAIAVVNADDPEVVRVAQASHVERVRTFGTSKSADVRLLSAEALEGERQRVRLEADGRTVDFELPLLGRHNAINAAAAVAMATSREDGATLEDAVTGLGRVERIKGRLRTVTVGRHTIVDDAYNANSASMLAAIEAVSTEARRKDTSWVALVGEMLELGSFSDEEHARVGRALAASLPRFVLAFGEAAEPVAIEARQSVREVLHEPRDVDAAWAWVRSRLAPSDLILVKGSRGARMERFIERLESEMG